MKRILGYRFHKDIPETVSMEPIVPADKSP